jgi:serine/threonine protein kinase
MSVDIHWMLFWSSLFRMYCPKCGSKTVKGQLFCSKCGIRLTTNDAELSGSNLTQIAPEDLTERNFLQQSLISRFKITRELGRGGFGVVFEATDLRLHRKVAIKALHLVKSSDEALVKRFIKEAQLSAALEHPNIVRIYTIDSAGAVHYFIMEYIEGPTLRQYTRQRNALSCYQTVKFCREIARALTFAHSKGIVHRDIKPHNIILKQEEIPVVTDFGIAKALDTDATQMTSGAIGSPHYISPEQLKNDEIDARADQYSLGIVMYEMLTGKSPFSGSGIALLHKQLHEKPAYLREIDPNIPQSVADIVNKLLEKDRENRFASTSELVIALDNLDLAKLPRKSLASETTMDSIDESISDLMREIKGALDERKYDRAIRLCEQGRELVPDNLDLVFLLQQAKTHKETADQAKIHINEGIENFHAKHYTKAIENWYRALVLDESNTDIQQLIEQAKKAQVEYRKAGQLFHEGKTLFEEQKYTDAVEKLRAVEALDPDYPGIQDLMRKAESAEVESRELNTMIDEAIELQKTHRHHESIDIFKKVLERDPDRTAAREGLEQSLIELELIKEIQKLQDRWPKYRKEQQYDKAAECLERLQSLRPEKRDHFEQIKREILREKDSEEKAAFFASQAVDAHRSKNYDEAVKLYDKVRQLNPKNAQLLAGESGSRNALENMREADTKIIEAQCLAKDGDYSSAVEMLRQAAIHAPDPLAVETLIDRFTKEQDSQDNILTAIQSDIGITDFISARKHVNEWLETHSEDSRVSAMIKVIEKAEEEHRKFTYLRSKIDQIKEKGRPDHALALLIKLRKLKPDHQSIELEIKDLQQQLGMEQESFEKKDSPQKQETAPPDSPPGSSRKKSRIVRWACFGIVYAVLFIIGIQFLVMEKEDHPAVIAPVLTNPTETPTGIPTAVAKQKAPDLPLSAYTESKSPTRSPTPMPLKTATPVPVISHLPKATSTPVTSRREVTSTPDPSISRAAQLYQKAATQFQKKRFREARKLVAEALILDSRNQECIALRGSLRNIFVRSDEQLQLVRNLMDQKKYKRAEEALTRLLENDPFNPEALRLKDAITGIPDTPRISPAEVLNFTYTDPAPIGKPFPVEIKVRSLEGITAIRLNYRVNRSRQWHQIEEMNLPAGTIMKTLVVPGRYLTRRGIQFFCEIESIDQQITRRGSAEHPILVKVRKKHKIPIGGM